jgi:hypothetical protein
MNKAKISECGLHSEEMIIVTTAEYRFENALFELNYGSYWADNMRCCSNPISACKVYFGKTVTGDKMLFRNTKELLPSNDFYIADMSHRVKSYKNPWEIC